MLPENDRGAAPVKSDPELYIQDQQGNCRTDRVFWTTVWCYLGALSVCQIVASLLLAVHS